MTDPVLWAIAALFGLQAKHLAADFLFQTPYMLANKGRYGHPGGLLHAALHGGLSLVVLSLAGLAVGAGVLIALAELVVHYHIDWSKERWTSSRALTTAMPDFWIALGVDQFLHQLTYLAMILAAWAALG